MTNLAVFSFEGQNVRFVEGKPVANDVAEILGYADPAATVSKKVFRQNKGVADLATPGGIQSVTVLEEAGIYQLIFSSKLPSAAKFQQWVFSEVLPSIRKTGSYSVAPAPEIQLPQTYLEALKALVATEEERQRLEAKVEQDAPLVAYAEAVQASETAVEVGDYAKMIGFGRNRLFRLLREMNVIMKNSTLPYQAWINAGYFEVSQEIDGAGKLIPFALITGKGQLWLKQKIDKHQRQGEQFAKMIYQGVLGIDGAV